MKTKHLLPLIALYVSLNAHAENFLHSQTANYSTGENAETTSFRISYGNAPGIEEEGSADEAPIRDDGGVQVELLSVKRFWPNNDSGPGWLLGGGLFFTQHKGVGEYDERYENWAFGLLIEGGACARWGDYLVFELTPFAGWGTDLIGAYVGAGDYFLYGIKGGVFVLLGDTVEIGLEVGFSGYSVTYTSDSPSDINTAAVVSLKF